VILPDGAFAAEAVYERSHLEVDPAYLTPMPSRIIRRQGDYFSLLGKFSNSGNYYHWIHDCLLRLHGVEGHLPQGVKYLVPQGLRGYQIDTLRMLGLREVQLVPFHAAEEVWDCERLWFASLPPSGAEVAEAVNWLRERIFSVTATPSPEPKRRLYISRQRATHARVVNERELIAVLEAHGFEIVETEGRPVAEQVRLFSQAEAIVAPHGAGQTNMLFSSVSCRNLELLEPQWASDGHAYVFWTLAETLGQSFSYVVAESVPNPDRPSRANLYVPPSVLDSALGSLFGAGG
jgi:capsular polysaccharide biosynthesis protein